MVPPSDPPVSHPAVSTPRPWDPAAEPTVEQLADWLAFCTSAERQSFAQHAIRNAADATRCVQMDHERRLLQGMLDRDIASTLVKEAYDLRLYSEPSSGGTERWREWDDKAWAYLQTRTGDAG
jgi:hypothetical protein